MAGVTGSRNLQTAKGNGAPSASQEGPVTTPNATLKRELGKSRVPDERRNRISELVKLVKETATAKGWNADTASLDRKNYRYATVSVWRQEANTSQEITGTYEISCDDKISITYHNTSFYSWGLKELYRAVSDNFWKLPWIKATKGSPSEIASDKDLIVRVLRRFHQAARQLKSRYSNRSGIAITDEYDVQDILHAFLRGLFDDVRPEEYTPSYAGGASRMDFLLKKEKIVIETKFASPTLHDSKIGEQLMVDIQRYSVHPDCRNLICFVYDPQGNLRNPAGLETDLSGTHNKLDVNLVIVSV